MSLFSRLKEGLSKTGKQLSAALNGIFTQSQITDELYDDLEETLIMADVGAAASRDIIDDIRARVKSGHVKLACDCRKLLEESLVDALSLVDDSYVYETEPSVVMVLGVNGTGKTTSVGKLAQKLVLQGKKVLIASADTFRAAADDQLNIWAERSGAQIVRGAQGADPASVVYDAAVAAQARNVDVLLVDTAGRLHNKKNLMDELCKIDRVLTRELPGRLRETFIVLDASTGQNALVQAQAFTEAVPVTGVILTKLDGTAKGGIVVAIHKQLGIPVKYIGVGEGVDDLQRFDAESYVKALLLDAVDSSESV